MCFCQHNSLENNNKNVLCFGTQYAVLSDCVIRHFRARTSHVMFTETEHERIVLRSPNLTSWFLTGWLERYVPVVCSLSSVRGSFLHSSV